MLGTWIEVLNPLEKLLFYEMDFETYVFKTNWLSNMVIEVFLKFRLELRN